MSWKKAARTFCVSLLAYFLVAQTSLMPLVRAKANETAVSIEAVGVLCLTSHQDGEKGDDSGGKPHVHGLDCCVHVARFVIDAPILAHSQIAFFSQPILATGAIEYLLPQGRAPPAITATPSKSRAPPIPA